MHKKLTPKQLSFIRAYIATGKKAQSAITAGYEAEFASITAWRLLQTPKVLDKILELTTNSQKAVAHRAHKVLVDLMENASESVRLRAAIELLNRSGLIVAQQHQHTHLIKDERTDSELLESIRALTDELGLGAKVIDGEVERPALPTQAPSTKSAD